MLDIHNQVHGYAYPVKLKEKFTIQNYSYIDYWLLKLRVKTTKKIQNRILLLSFWKQNFAKNERFIRINQ